MNAGGVLDEIASTFTASIRRAVVGASPFGPFRSVDATMVSRRPMRAGARWCRRSSREASLPIGSRARCCRRDRATSSRSRRSVRERSLLLDLLRRAQRRRSRRAQP